MHKYIREVFVITSLFLFTPFGLQAQSLEDLEAEILGDSSGSSFEDYPSAPPPAESVPDEVDTRDGRSYEEERKSQDFGFEESKADPSALKRVDEFIKGPRQIPFRHILVVRPRYINKTGKHEITPFMLGIQPGDSFRKQVSMGGSYTYHLTEDFALEAIHFLAYTNIKTGFQKDLRENANLEIERIEPVFSIGPTLQWSPFKAKSATHENIYHFEGYLFAGGGFTKFEVGNSAMAMFGVGARVFLNRFAALKLDIRDYYDFKEDAGQRLNILLGASILLGGN